MDILAAIKREEKKLEKQLGKLRISGRCKNVGPLSGERSSRREEARFVGSWSSGDFKGNEEVG
jgi:hypothetical protein